MQRARLRIGVSFTLVALAAPAADDCPTLVDRARKAFESRQFEAAITEFGRAVTVCPQARPLLLPLAQAQLMAQRLPDAIRTLEELLQLDPVNLEALKLRGDALYLAGQEQEAERSLQAALAIDGSHQPSLYALGRIYYQQNRFPEAVERFRAVVGLDPKAHRAYDNLALCYEALHQDKEALQHFLKALDLVHKDHPGYDTVYADFANFLLNRNEYEKAFQFAAEAAKRNPAAARNFFLTGKALVRLGKHELSLRWLEQANRLDASYPEARYLMAQTYRRLGREKEADEQLAKFRELNRNPRARR